MSTTDSVSVRQPVGERKCPRRGGVELRERTWRLIGQVGNLGYQKPLVALLLPKPRALVDAKIVATPSRLVCLLHERVSEGRKSR